MNETILKNINSKRNNPEELQEYLTELKNRGVLTQGEVNNIIENMPEPEEGRIRDKKLGQRTPDTIEYGYSNVSAGFGSTAIIGLLALSGPAIIAMISMLSK